MRGSRVTWSPDSPRNEAVKNPRQAGEPRGKKNVFTTVYIYLQIIASGNPLPLSEKPASYLSPIFNLY
jgi:hypothetical protein